MEKRLNKKIGDWCIEFKDNIRAKINELSLNDKDKINELFEYLYEYEKIIFDKDDIVKRKRIKNSIPSCNRCNARRANGEQCTRKRKDGFDCCGTHSKGTPNGCMIMNDASETLSKKIDVCAQDIGGIVHYIDNFNNVYKTEDVLQGRENPRIVATCLKMNGVNVIQEV